MLFDVYVLAGLMCACSICPNLTCFTDGACMSQIVRERRILARHDRSVDGGGVRLAQGQSILPLPVICFCSTVRFRRLQTSRHGQTCCEPHKGPAALGFFRPFFLEKFCFAFLGYTIFRKTCFCRLVIQDIDFLSPNFFSGKL